MSSKSMNNFSFKEYCDTCLSVNRSLHSIEGYRTVFDAITINLQLEHLQNLIKVCWECRALLKQVTAFQHKVKMADIYRRKSTKEIKSLSTLSVNQMKDTDYNFNYEDEIELKEDVKLICEDIDRCSTPEIKDEINLNTEEIEVKIEPKIEQRRSKWAIERAKENKKPKFKILNEKTVMYERVRASAIEIYELVKMEKDRDINNLPHQCKLCNYGFCTEKDFLEHDRKIHTEDTVLICDVCKRGFKSRTTLIKHLTSHRHKYKCNMCHYESLSVRKAKTHFNEEHNKTIQCLKCDLRFSTRPEFRTHYRRWHENYVCDHCGVSFRMKYSIEEHLRTQHSPYVCKPCNRSFSRYNGLWLHNKVAHSPGLEPAYCVECDRSYRNAYTYRWHLANSVRHNVRRKSSIPCPGCGKVFSKRIYMKDHYDLVHLKIYKYRCQPCDKNFTRNAELVRHTRAVHECIPKDRNKICYVCGRGFSSNEILANHIRVHTGERPFECLQCSSKFTQKVALTSHMKTVHAERSRSTKK